MIITKRLSVSLYMIDASQAKGNQQFNVTFLLKQEEIRQHDRI